MPSGISIVAFYVIAIVLVGSALAVVLMRNIVHAALFLAAFFGAAAGIYVLLNAEFIAIIQVLIYAGAVTILVLFAIMLTQGVGTSAGNPFAGQWWLAAPICLILGGAIIYAVSGSKMAIGSPDSSVHLALSDSSNGGTVVHLGQLLYSPFSYSYVLPFEIASVVLLVAIIGAIVIGRED